MRIPVPILVASLLLAGLGLVQGASGGEFEELAEVLHDWRGDRAGEQFGWVARVAGDVDGDGLDDVIASAPFRGGAGRVLVWSCKSGELLHEKAGRAGEQLGRVVCGLGDVDGDGRDDFAAGAPGAQQGQGRAYVWSGATGEELLVLDGFEPGASFGLYVAPLGDVDGDGHADLAVAAPTAGPGVVLFYSGKSGEELGALEGERDGDSFGSALGVGGPAGARRLVVGAKDAGEGRRGRVYVHDLALPTPELAFVIESEPTGVDLGRFFVSVVGDVDADGVPDVYAADFADGSSPDATGRAGGRIYVHSGKDGARLLCRGALEPGEGFGIGDARAGDQDGDGHDDLVVGAWTSSAGAPAAGRVYLLSGKDFSVLRTITSKVAGEAFGFDATGLGDLTGDGVPELLVTAAYHPEAGPQTGRTLVLKGGVPGR